MSAAFFSMIRPWGYQTNILIYGPGVSVFLDYTKVVVPLNIPFRIPGTVFNPVLWDFLTMCRHLLCLVASPLIIFAIFFKLPYGVDFKQMKWLLQHIIEYDRPFLLKEPQKHFTSNEIKDFEEFEQQEIDRRRHKRIRYDLVLDEDILGYLYNANTIKSGSATVVDLSAGGLKIYTDLGINLGDLLIISCRV